MSRLENANFSVRGKIQFSSILRNYFEIEICISSVFSFYRFFRRFFPDVLEKKRKL